MVPLDQRSHQCENPEENESMPAGRAEEIYVEVRLFLGQVEYDAQLLAAVRFRSSRNITAAVLRSFFASAWHQ